MLLIVANSVSDGKKAGFVSALGIASGAFIHFITAAFGISAIVIASEFAYDVIRLLGAGYLAWIGFQFLTSESKTNNVAIAGRRNMMQIYRQGVFTNLINPKAILFNLSFVPQFVSVEHGAVWAQMLLLGGILIVIGVLVNLTIVILASRLSSTLTKKQFSVGGYIKKLSGLLLIGFATYLALDRKPV